MKKCCSGLAVVLLSLTVFGVGRAQVDFHGVLDPNNHSLWIDTVVIIVPPTPETVFTTGWGADSVGVDTFDFPDLTAWPLLVELHGRVDTVRTRQVFPAPVNGQWYTFMQAPPPPPKVMFYGETGAEESRPGMEVRPRLSVSPSVLTDKVTVRAQVAGPGTVQLEIVDAAGNVVRSLGTHRPGNAITEVWPGDNDAGQKLSEGVYFCRLSIGDDAVVRKVLLAR